MIPGLRLHHVGIVVADLNHVSAEYTRRFGFLVRSLVVHDPLQEALVQFLQLPGDSTFLELLTPDGPRSRLAPALQRGGGPNHLGFATRDIVGAHRTMLRHAMVDVLQPTPAVPYQGRRVSWVRGSDHQLFELVEQVGSDLHMP